MENLPRTCILSIAEKRIIQETKERLWVDGIGPHDSREVIIPKRVVVASKEDVVLHMRVKKKENDPTFMNGLMDRYSYQ